MAAEASPDEIEPTPEDVKAEEEAADVVLEAEAEIDEDTEPEAEEPEPAQPRRSRGRRRRRAAEPEAEEGEAADAEQEVQEAGLRARIAGPDMMLTLEYRPDRITLLTDADGVVIEVRAG